MNDVERITVIANQLANNGKKPTVALIKSKLPNPLPLAKIINALRHWQHEPENCEFTVGSLPDDTVVPDKATDEDPTSKAIELAVNKALAPIKAELAEIKALLHQLIKK